MITQTLCSIFKLNLFKALEDFDPASASVYKIALYSPIADLDASTLAYTTLNEVVGTGYVAGGMTLTKVEPSLSGTTAFISFDPVTWSPAEFTTRGALIYNATTNAAVAVLNFGPDKTATLVFTVTFPTNNADNAVIKIQ